MNFQDCIDFVLKNPKIEIAFHQPAAPSDLVTLPDLGTVASIGTLLRVTGRLEFARRASIPWISKPIYFSWQFR